MVAPAGTETGPDRVRPLNLPRPVQVTVDERTSLPVALRDSRGAYPVARVQDSWRVDDEWWREPVSRLYVQLVLPSGALRTLFHDLVADRWFEQNY